MAKFKRFVLGSMLGAGVAYLLSRKEVRKALMGAGRKALPAAGPGGFENEYSAAPSAEGAISDEAGFEAKIAETRRQVTEHIDSFAGGEPAVSVPAAEAEENEAEEEPISFEEEPAVTAEAEVAAPAEVEPEPEPAPPAAEVEPEPVTPAAEIEPEPAPEPSPPAAVSEPEMEPALPAARAETELEAAPVETGSEVQPEPPAPTLEAELTISSEAEAPGPSAPSPSGIDREEMRRRIDETRARLKAKAFDAMIGGETFIDETSVEKEAAHREKPGEFDEDLDKSIDESLREQD